MIEAARFGHHEILARLLSVGANGHASEGSGWTAVDWAAQYGHHECISALFWHLGAENVKTHKGIEKTLPPCGIRTLSVLQDIAAGMCFLHSHSVIHRDLKSANVLFNRQLQVKLCDFAFSKLKQQVVEESPPPPTDDNGDGDGDAGVQSAAARSAAAPRAPRGGLRPEPRPTWGGNPL